MHTIRVKDEDIFVVLYTLQHLSQLFLKYMYKKYETA